MIPGLRGGTTVAMIISCAMLGWCIFCGASPKASDPATVHVHVECNNAGYQKLQEHRSISAYHLVQYRVAFREFFALGCRLSADDMGVFKTSGARLPNVAPDMI